MERGSLRVALAGRTVKCRITGETGSDKEFFRGDDGKYYKSMEVYEEYCRQKDARTRLISIIASDFFNYQKGQKFPPAIYYQLKKLNFYPNTTILHTVEKYYTDIIKAIQTKEFKNDQGKAAYIFAIISNRIADVYKFEKAEKIRIRRENEVIKSLDMNEIYAMQERAQPQKNKDISRFLEDDDK